MKKCYVGIDVSCYSDGDGEVCEILHVGVFSTHEKARTFRPYYQYIKEAFVDDDFNFEEGE